MMNFFKDASTQTFLNENANISDNQKIEIHIRSEIISGSEKENEKVKIEIQSDDLSDSCEFLPNKK